MSKDGPVCYGESVSLKVSARPEEDTKVARRLFDLED